jgi:hypothetical protein
MIGYKTIDFLLFVDFFDLLQDVGVNDEFLRYHAILKDLHDALTSKKSNPYQILVVYPFINHYFREVFLIYPHILFKILLYMLFLLFVVEFS